MDQLRLVASLQVPEDGGVVKIGQIHHVLAFFKLGSKSSELFLSTVVKRFKMEDLGRVDSANLASLQREFLVTENVIALLSKGFY